MLYNISNTLVILESFHLIYSLLPCLLKGRKIQIPGHWLAPKGKYQDIIALFTLTVGNTQPHSEKTLVTMFLKTTKCNHYSLEHILLCLNVGERRRWRENELSFVFSGVTITVHLLYLPFPLNVSCVQFLPITAFFFFLPYKSCTVKFNILKCTIQGLWYIHKVVQPLPPSNIRKFSSLQKETAYPLSVTSHFPLPSAWHRPLATTNLLSEAIDLPVLNTSYKQNHTKHVLLYLASFT